MTEILIMGQLIGIQKYQTLVLSSNFEQQIDRIRLTSHSKRQNKLQFSQKHTPLLVASRNSSDYLYFTGAFEDPRSECLFAYYCRRKKNSNNVPLYSLDHKSLVLVQFYIYGELFVCCVLIGWNSVPNEKSHYYGGMDEVITMCVISNKSTSVSKKLLGVRRKALILVVH